MFELVIHYICLFSFKNNVFFFFWSGNMRYVTAATKATAKYFMELWKKDEPILGLTNNKTLP